MSRYSPSVRTALFAGAAFAGLVAAPAFAQDSTPAAPSQTEEATEYDGDIVVTARRREERLLDVPGAVTAISGAKLEAQGAIDVTDISNLAPNVTFENSRGTNSTLTAFIRGVGQQDPVPGFEAGVGIYLDDIYLNRPQAAVLDIYEVERIEVLRGPQGTLYGRNTIGGALKYVTKALPDQLTVSARGTYGSYNQLDGVLTVSGPVGAGFKFGGSVARLTRDGFGKNLHNGLENYNKDVWATRGTLEFESPDNRMSIRVAGDYSWDKSNPRNGHRLFPSMLTNAPVLSNVFDTRAGLNNPKQDVQGGGLAMTARAELSDNITIKSISAWRKDRSYAPIDFDSLPSVDVDVPAVYRNEQISQEFQLAYSSEKLNGILGFYYLDAEASTAFDVILGTTGAALSLPGFNAYTAGRVKTQTPSIYGDFTYDLTPQFSISVGGRYTWDKRDAWVYKASKLGGTSPEFGGTATVLGAPSTNFNGKANFQKFTPRASLSFKPSPDHTLYASYSKGFKGGGFDPRGSANIAPETNGTPGIQYDEIYNFIGFDPETVDSYEIGWKGSLFDRSLNFAINGFYAKYNNVQIPGSVGVDANKDGIFESFAGVTTNAARADFKGIEAEFNARLARDYAGPGSAFTLDGSLGYIDARYKEFYVNGVNVAGQRHIQNTPEWTLSGTLGTYLPVGDGRLNVSTSVSYRSKTYQFETAIPWLDQDGYALWDANLTYSFGEDGRYTIGVHGKNLANQRYITSGYNYLTYNPVTKTYASTLGLEGVATAFYGNPRQVFGTFSLKF
ncbi:TonB-dependent receptor [Sphingomonas soli]|uniref:TonB-dependent receptor n=1 Tax=Sphingomonas soli TaxID=266127 RepID=UPI00082CA531|nr:TonB-dependent receptor [Sphingomonas soli]